MITNSLSDLSRRIQNRTVKVCVVGLGYVGLPLAVAFANVGCRTIGVDTDKSRIEAVAEGRPYGLTQEWPHMCVVEYKWLCANYKNR